MMVDETKLRALIEELKNCHGSIGSEVVRHWGSQFEQVIGSESTTKPAEYNYCGNLLVPSSGVPQQVSGIFDYDDGPKRINITLRDVRIEPLAISTPWRQE